MIEDRIIEDSMRAVIGGSPTVTGLYAEECTILISMFILP